jgi:hypothetical protein
VKPLCTFLLLLAVRTLARICYRFDAKWLGWSTLDPGPVDRLRIIALLNHTSLYEAVFVALAPKRLLWRMARGGVLPVADETMRQLGAGAFFRLVAGRVVPISRKRDDTWDEVLRSATRDTAISVLCPEGRMLRTTGLDKNGEPMRVRSGIADVIGAAPDGLMLLVYSGGLHHVVAPGQRWPRPFRRIRVRLELVEIEEYRQRMASLARDQAAFRTRVVQDLTRRRNAFCPVHASGSTLPSWAREVPGRRASRASSLHAQASSPGRRQHAGVPAGAPS